MTETEQAASRERIVAWLNNPGAIAAAQSAIEFHEKARLLIKVVAAQLESEKLEKSKHGT